MSEAGRLVDRDGVAAPSTYSTAVGEHGGLVRGVADALQFQCQTAAAEDRGAIPKWLVLHISCTRAPPVLENSF